MQTPSASAENSQEWEHLVGLSMLRFGDIEFVSVKLLHKVCPEKSPSAISNLPFKQRAADLISLLEARNRRTEPEENLLIGFRRAKELADIRNLVAHNPVMMEIYVNAEETESYVEHAIRSIRFDDEFLDIAGVKEFAGEVDWLSSVIWLNYCKAVDSSSDLWRLVDGRKDGDEA